MGLRRFFTLLPIIFVLLQCSLATVTQRNLPASFMHPTSEAVDHVNPLIGNGGSSPTDSGGMIPSTAPPFAMTRWVAQTRTNHIGDTPYNYTDSSIHGFQGTHQPAIWMGESGHVTVCPGAGTIRSTFEDRGMAFSHEKETTSPSYYSVELEAVEGGKIFAELSATSRVGHLRLMFSDTKTPYVLLEATRASMFSSDVPNGSIVVDPDRFEICGSNPERQDKDVTPVSTPATKWSGYFCATFDEPFASWGIAQEGVLTANEKSGTGGMLSAYATFSPTVSRVNVKIAVSFISIDQARKNLEKEIPDGQALEETAKQTRAAWAEKLDRIQLTGATDEQKQVFYTAFFHTLQYPCEQDEYGRYYSGCDNSVHEGVSYTGYSTWFADQRDCFVNLLKCGWLPLWKNILEANVMVGTHADSLIGEAVKKGYTDFDLEAAWNAVHKDATVPPIGDSSTQFYARQEFIDYKARAGLSSFYEQKGWVAYDIHTESASRTLAYAYDDFAVSVLAGLLNKTKEEVFFRQRAMSNSFTIFNHNTGFMQARNGNGSWAGPDNGDGARYGPDNGWTEGDKRVYTFDVVHNIPGLIEHKGGNKSFVDFMDEYFDGGHNDHTNEPSHHVPYLYSLAGAASKTQARVRQIVESNYNASVNGLSGNDDCGQMSAWYIFSTLGFYPVCPVLSEYVVGSPLFDKVSIDLPSGKKLDIISPGASSSHYVYSVSINGRELQEPIIRHEDITQGGVLLFQMRDTPQNWGSGTL